jgi:anti-sigma factor ChrR (cupin superfamily)
MPLQNITPINNQLADIVVRSDEPWIEMKPGMAWVNVLWTSPETGRWAVLFRWKKGYVASRHKHLAAAHVYMLKDRIQARDLILEAGDFDYEPNGIIHDATTALEDSEYLFICDGPLVYFDDNGLTSYLSWEELQRMKEAATAKQWVP